MAFMTLQGTSGSPVEIPVKADTLKAEQEIIGDVERAASGALRAAVTAVKKTYEFEVVPSAAGASVITFLLGLVGTFATLDGDAFTSTAVFVTLERDERLLTVGDNNKMVLRFRLVEA